MVTFVINLNCGLNDWSLVKPIFYQALTSKNLFIHDCKDISDPRMAKEVCQCLTQNRFTRWQIVFLVELRAGREAENQRLSEYLYLIKNRFLSEIHCQGLGPEHIFIIALDTLKRNRRTGLPEDALAGQLWQLDRDGLISDSSCAGKEYFRTSELLLLDQAWGENLDLPDAGPLQNPREKFLKEITMRAKRVETAFLKLLKNKKKDTDNPDRHPDLGTAGSITKENLKSIRKEFTEGLAALIKPPLNNDIDRFKPSALLKKVLQKNLSLKAYIRGCKLLVFPFPSLPESERARSLINLALLILLISTGVEAKESEDLYQKLKNDSFYLEFEFDENLWGKAINDYLASLDKASLTLESQLTDPAGILIESYSSGEDYTGQIQLPNQKVPDPPGFGLLKGSKYISDWNLYVENARHFLERQKNEFGYSLETDIKNLPVVKRSNVVKSLKKINNLDIELKKTEAHLAALEQELARIYIHATDEPDHWINEAGNASREMEYSLESRPSKQQVIVGFLAGGLLLIIAPYCLCPINRELSWNDQNFYYMLVFLTAGSLFATFWSIKRIHQEVCKLVVKFKNILQSLIEEQINNLKKSKNYLNKLYQIYQGRQAFLSLKQQSARLRQENVLLKYHQKHISNHIELAKKIGKLTVSSKEELDTGVAGGPDKKNIPALDIKQDVYNNPLYSLLFCISNAGDDRNQISVNIRGIDYHFSVPFDSQLIKIYFKEDWVYSL